MKTLFVRTLRALVCAGSIAVAAEAAPSITIAIEVNVNDNYKWTEILYAPQNGGSIAEGAFFSNDNKRVSRGTFSTVFAVQESGVDALWIFSQQDHVNPIGWLPVSGLSSSGTSATNAFILEISGGGTSMTFRSMNGGLSGYNGGVVSKFLVDESNDKIYFIGDFGTGSTSYQDFRVWDIGNVAWDTYYMTLAGYDGYWPANVQKTASNELTITLSSVANAYGGVRDDVYGWQTIPWTTHTIKWNISSRYWYDPQN